MENMENKIYIDGIEYEYVNNILYKGKTYVAYMDEDKIYISEYSIHDGNVIFSDITDELFDEVKEVMVL